MLNTIGFHNMGLSKGQFIVGAVLVFQTSTYSPKREIMILKIQEGSNGVLRISATFLSTPCEGTYNIASDSLVLTNNLPAEQWLRILQGEQYVDEDHPWNV